jgi:DNA invertase Pin-like site-specific DNA recombinase
MDMGTAADEIGSITDRLLREWPEGASLTCAAYVRSATGGPSATAEQARKIGEAVSRRRATAGQRIDVREYADVDASGNAPPGPGLAALLRDAARGEFDLVLVTDVARLGRSPERLRRVMASLEDAGVRVMEVTDALRT